MRLSAADFMPAFFAIGAYAAILKARGEPLHYPGGPGRVSQAITCTRFPASTAARMTPSAVP